MRRAAGVALVLMASAGGLAGQERLWRQTQADDYTRYELLPAAQSFRILYYVTATTRGVMLYFNTIRRGSEPTVHGTYDLMSGAALPWEMVDGRTARAMGMSNADTTGRYIKIQLARPVPEQGETRLLIDKTYRDPASVFLRDQRVVFSRTLGINRNSVVLPTGHELVTVNYPSQVMTEADGRVKVSFINPGPSGVPYVVEGRPLASAARTVSAPVTRAAAGAGVAGGSAEFTERAFQDREIVYFLEPPETHAFRLYHDYTETRPGVDRYVNVVRAGSRASNPSARNLDTGQPLRVETLRGDAIAQRGIEIGSPVTAASEVVVIWFDPVPQGHSTRLRIEETYTDANRYYLAGEELVWDRAFGRPRNAVVLPDGWYLTTSSIPAVVSETNDGRIRLDFTNDRPDEIAVFLKARHR